MATAEAKTNLMATTWTQAALVRRAFNAGPRRKSDRQFDDIEGAVLESFTEFLDLRKRMKAAELPTRNVRAALALMTAVYEGAPFNAGVVTLLAIPDTIKGLPTLLYEAERYTKKGSMIPLGLVFWQRDKDPKAKVEKTVWVQSWRVDPRVRRAADKARDFFDELEGQVPEGGLCETFEE